MTNRISERLGLGLAALGRPAYITTGRDRDLAERNVDDMRTRTFDVLDSAYKLGIRYLDTARSYGHAEEFLAAWLREHPEITDVTIASKWGYRYVGDWRMDAEVHEVKDHSLDAFTEQLRQTQTLLGHRLDLYQVHSLTDDSPLWCDTRLHESLARLRDAGTRIGLTTSGPHQDRAVRAALDLTIGGAPLFSAIQSTWNLLESSVGPALVDAHQHGFSIVIKECFANGRLAPGSGDHSPRVQQAAVLAADEGLGIDQLAIAAALAQPFAPRVLSGAVTPGHLRSHLDGTHHRMTDDVLAQLTTIAEDPDHYWTARSQRTWS